MRISRKTQNTIKNVVSAVLAIAILLGVASLIGGLTRADDEERVKVHPTFSVGGLNEVGKYVEDDGTIYTKEAFECQGLKIELDFERTICYEVYFYNENGDFLSSTDKSNVNSTPKLPAGATHARIVITPDWDVLEIEKEKEQVVKWYEVAKYANQITVKVNEEQLEAHEINQYSFFELTELGVCHRVAGVMSDTSSMENYKTNVTSIDVTSIDEIKICVPNGGYICYIFYDSTGANLMSGENGVNGSSGANKETITVPSDAAYVNFNISYKNVSETAKYEIYFK